MTTSVAASSPKIAASVQPQKQPEWHLDVPVPIVVALIMASVGFAIWRLTAWTNARQAQRNRAAEAAAKFRSAFAPDLAAAEADTRNGINYMEFLRAAYNERHEQAFITFAPFVLIKKGPSFNSDWDRYRYGENADGTVQQPDPEDMDHKSLYFLEYSIEWDLRRPEMPRENAIKRIRKLLSYASAA